MQKRRVESPLEKGNYLSVFCSLQVLLVDLGNDRFLRQVSGTVIAKTIYVYEGK